MIRGADRSAVTARVPWRRYGAAFTGTRPVLRQGDPGIDAAWLRRRRLGEAGAALWVVTVPVLLASGSFSAWGPFGGAATWQLATFGFNSAIWLTIPLLPLAFLPLLVARVARIGVDTPVLLGMRQSFDASWGPRVEEVGGVRTILRRRGRIARGLTLAGVVAFAVLAGKAWRDAAAPHVPLPEVEYARLIDPARVLPPAVRVTDAVADRSREWTHAYTVRSDVHRDVYYPPRPAGGQASDPVALVEMSATSPQYDAAPWNMADPPGPREGVPAPLDAWTAERMRAAGFPLAAHVMLLERRQLAGRSPYPDPITDMVFAAVAASIAFVSALMWWGTRLGERRLDG